MVIEPHTALKNKGLTCDQTIQLTGARVKNGPIRLRFIGDIEADTGIQYTFLTHHFKLSARTIADIYKARWQSASWVLQKCRIDPNSESQILLSHNTFIKR